MWHPFSLLLMASEESQMSDVAGLVSEAFVYGYPLIVDVDEVVRFTQSGMGSVPAAPFNHFSHARTLAGPKDTFVTINNDTLYSIAQFDLNAGPLFLDVPDTDGRYYVLQFIDAWTNNFAYVGRRASGTEAATYLLTPPAWTGDVPAGITVIEFPTRVASILGRWACSRADDLDAVHALQDQLVLRPAGNPEPVIGVPAPAAGVSESLMFFEKLRTWMAAFPPAPADQDYHQRLAPLGLLEKTSPYVDPPTELAETLAQSLTTAQTGLEAFTRTGTVPKVNGWMPAPTPSTTTWTTSAPAPSTPRSGRSPTRSLLMPCGPWRPGPACGATTPMRPPTPRSSRTTEESN
jgi:hypothetical protein